MDSRARLGGVSGPAPMIRAAPRTGNSAAMPGNGVRASISTKPARMARNPAHDTAVGVAVNQGGSTRRVASPRSRQARMPPTDSSQYRVNGM